ncbi:MAG: DUF4252 domain-containing protein [Chitinophagaceae bacterium]|nr:DUF4252 domain-containing protein [Chitinophagaceae bacterium]
MKKVFLLALAVLPLSLFAQNSLPGFFDKYAGHTGFTTVKISPKMFDLIASVDVEDADLSVVKDITGINVLVYEPEEGKTTDLTDKLYTEAKATGFSGYEELLSVVEEGTDIRILAKSAGEGIVSDLLIVGKDDGEFIYVNIAGKMDIKKLSSLANDTDIKGLDHLKDIDNEDKK